MARVRRRVVTVGTTETIEAGMPERPRDAPHFTKKANTPKKRRAHAEIRNRLLAEGASEGKAARIANAAVRRIRDS